MIPAPSRPKPSLKLVAVSIVKNEVDIIEAFVRHTAAWVDLHLIFDHDSTDGTREILAELVREGLPLRLFIDSALGNLQQVRSNALTRAAVHDHGADWILPLDADEFLQAPDRATLEAALGPAASDTPLRLPMVNYFPLPGDHATEINPVLRLQHRILLPQVTCKVAIPCALAADPAVVAAKGSHALLRSGLSLPDRAAPGGIFLAHFPQRSLGQQVVRIVSAELQKLSLGAAHAGLDTHYRRLFHLLAEHPDLFAESISAVQGQREFAPIHYRGGPLRHLLAGSEWMRVVRALAPFLEELARSHGRLLDRAAPAVIAAAGAESEIVPLPPSVVRPIVGSKCVNFHGFVVEAGLGPPEGPFPAMLLPRFHWGLAPETILGIDASPERLGKLELEAITYIGNQTVAILLDDAEVHRLSLPQVDQPVRLALLLPLRGGSHRLTFRYERFVQTAADSRQLALIFTALRVT